MGFGRVTQGSAHHARVGGIAGESGYVAVGGDLTTGYLADNTEHVALKGAYCRGCHSVKVVFHSMQVSKSL